MWDIFLTDKLWNIFLTDKLWNIFLTDKLWDIFLTDKSTINQRLKNQNDGLRQKSAIKERKLQMNTKFGDKVPKAIQ